MNSNGTRQVGNLAEGKTGVVDSVPEELLESRESRPGGECAFPSARFFRSLSVASGPMAD